jgi:shikimate 5-dehydrogenase
MQLPQPNDNTAPMNVACIIHSSLDGIYMQWPHPIGRTAPMNVAPTFHSGLDGFYMQSPHPINITVPMKEVLMQFLPTLCIPG